MQATRERVKVACSRVKPSSMLRSTIWDTTPREQIWNIPVVMATSQVSLQHSSFLVVQPPVLSWGP